MTPRTRATPEQIALIKSLISNNLGHNAQTLIEKSNLYSADFASPKTEEILKGFITNDPAMLKVKGKCRILSCVSDPVLIQGETGTGKEILAKSLHGERDGKFLAINCGALPEQLLESELFGHVSGAFTGAVRDKDGIFVAAKDGTVFLDEVGELPFLSQSALLRTIQERTVRKLGTSFEQPILCRIVCATWRDLRECIKEKTFREDLYYRLSRVTLNTSPLRERREDILEILDHLDVSHVVCEELREKLKESILLGNVRELENVIRNLELFGEI